MADTPDWRELSNNQRDLIEQQRILIAELCNEGDTFRRMLAAANELLATRELQIVALRQALHEATERGDAHAAYPAVVVLTDATDPGPKLVAETRAAFPINALRGGNGVPH
jgi:hypothetical protein